MLRASGKYFASGEYWSAKRKGKMACIRSASSSCGVGNQRVQDSPHVLVITGSPWAACYAVMVVFIVNVAADMQKHSQLATISKAILMSCQLHFTSRYTGPLESITMWLCMILSSRACELLQQLEGAWGIGNLLQSTRLSMSEGRPINPHPLDVLQHILLAQSS